MKKILISVLAALIFIVPARAGEVYPILVSNGEDFIPCDGQFYTGWTVPLSGQQVVASYMSGNLLTDPGFGADVILHSPSYGFAYPQPYENGPSSQWGSIGELHIFSQPNGHTGGRQGDRYMSFQPDGITINDYVQLVIICWGGGTLELYAQIWVRDAP